LLAILMPSEESATVGKAQSFDPDEEIVIKNA
jgi:hypothetical protein